MSGVLTREQAYVAASSGRMYKLAALRAIVVHHSATPRGATFAAIERGHTSAPRHYAMIGYHAIVLGDGSLCEGRPLPLGGAHAPPRNHDTLALCIVGDNTRPEHRWQQQQIDAAKRWLDAVDVLVPGLPIYGHRDIKATLCPGIERDELLTLLRR